MLAPYLSFVPGVPAVRDRARSAATSTAPTTATIHVFGHTTYMQLADPPIGILFALAMSSIAVYGVMLAGWSSGSKYPLLGSVRASAQMVSYEAALGPVGRGRHPQGGHAHDPRHRRVPGRSGVGQRDPQLGHPRHRRRALRDLRHRRHGRAQPAAVRPGRGRAGARRRLQHRVQLDPLRPVLPGRVHEHDHHVGHLRDAVPRRPERPGLLRARLDVGLHLVLPEAHGLPVRVRLVAGHAAPVPLRPAHGPRVEGADPARARVAAAAGRHRHRPRRDVEPGRRDRRVGGRPARGLHACCERRSRPEPRAAVCNEVDA